LAETQKQIHWRLLQITPTTSPELEAAWRAAAEACLSVPAAPPKGAISPDPEQYLILLTCRDERHQVELLTRFQGEGLECRALLA
jgi:hypothetical protein